MRAVCIPIPAALSLLVGAMLVGCSSTPIVRPKPEAPPLPEHAPDDFTLSITVMGPAATLEEATAAPRPQRPARYIIEPDGILRAAVGPGATPRVFPGQTRQLDDAQIERLWRLTTNTGLLEPDTLARVENTETFFPSRDRPTALLYIKEDGHTASYAVRLPIGDAESPAVTQLIDEIAAMAWIPE
ncbi:MAG: hypothetical protein IPJ41_03475 [Phycisphaerales bacterium]|nr:hypothetical protein [Phycisphaerales bacterium]